MNTEKAVSKVIHLNEYIGKNLRYERKYVCEHTNLNDLIQTVKANSFGFNEIYAQRGVHNLYLDDNNLNFYKQNVEGIGNREKFRLRWYGNDITQIKDPTFEIKIKFGEIGDKISYTLSNFKYDLTALDINHLYSTIKQSVQRSNPLIESKIHQLLPALFNSYERRYFLSACRRFRITLDFNQSFYNPQYTNFLLSKRTIDQREIILELKYDPPYDAEARQISQQFQTRVSKNSKYVRGIQLVY